MEFMVLLLALGYVVRTEGSWNELPVHPGVGGLYRGPNSETIIKGPDGSVITAEAAGGSIQTQGTLEPIVVADLDVQPYISAAPDLGSASVISTAGVSRTALPVAEISAVATPAVAAPAIVAPALTTVTEVPLSHTVEIVQADPHIIQTEIVDAPVVEPQQSSDLVGPSGSISTRGSSSVVSGPASTTISEPARVLVAAPVVAAVPVAASVTTPLLAAPAAEVIPDSVATASIGLQPAISTVTVGSPISISTLAPPTSWESERVFSSTPLPPATWDLGQNEQTFSHIISSTQAPPTILYRQGELNSHSISANQANLESNQQSLGTSTSIGQLSASVEPASSYGVLNNIVNPALISSTIRPELSVTPSQFTPTIPSQELLPPPVSQVNLNVPTADASSLNQAVSNNRQLNINPSLIPSANIIPPEIGPLPAGAIDLGNTITISSTPRGLGLSPTESPNIQRTSEVDSAIVDNNIRHTDERLIYDGRLGQLGENPGRSVDINELSFTLPESIRFNAPLLRNTNPIPTGISRNGLIGAQLAKYRIDASQINLSNVPLSSVIPLGADGSLPLSYEDSSSVLWNRYGRDVKTKKN